MAGILTSIGNYVSQMFSPSFNPPLVEVPVDQDDPRYTQSFTVDQVNEYKKFFEEYGFVVIRDVLTKEECEASIDEIWTYIETRAFLGRRSKNTSINTSTLQDSKFKPICIKRDDPSSWDDGWPSLANEGIVGLRPVFTKQALMNRQNSKVYSVFKNLLEEEALMVNHDRFGLFRPTKNEHGKLIHPEWKTVKNVHLDMNPWIYTLPRGGGGGNDEFDYNSLKYEYVDDFIEENNHPGKMEDGQLHVQASLNFSDNLSEDGGFQLVPGFHKVFKEWTERSRNRLGKEYSNKMNFIVLPEQDPVWSHAQRITSRQGSLLIWNQLIAHGSAPNNSHRPRYAQFLKFQKAFDISTPWGIRRKEAIKERIAESGVVLTELGEKLFTQKPW